MKLLFDKKCKTKIIGTRLTEKEYEEVRKIAQNNRASLAETARILIISAIAELNKK